MKPNPFASLNHFTFPVVRIPNSFVVIDAGSEITPTLPNQNPRTGKKVQTTGKNGNSRTRAATALLVSYAADPNHVVVRLAKTVRRHSPVLLVLKLKAALRHRIVDRLRDRIVAHRKHEDLRHRPGHVDHRQLAFPRLAEPAFARELLHEPHTL